MSGGEEIIHQVLHTKCYYTRLGVSKSASEDEIKRAYKKLALKLHPDRNKHPKAEDAFKLVGTAHGVLTDPAKRREYDQVGEEGMRYAGGGGHRGAHFARHAPEDIFDMFDILRGHHMNQQFRRQHQHQHRGQPQNPFLVNLIQVLPLAVILLALMLSGMGLDRQDNLPFSLDRNVDRGFVIERRTSVSGIPYYVRTNFKREYGHSHSLREVERSVTDAYQNYLHKKCQQERYNRKIRMERARDYANHEEMRQKAMAMKTPSCKEYQRRFPNSRHSAVCDDGGTVGDR